MKILVAGHIGYLGGLISKEFRNEEIITADYTKEKVSLTTDIDIIINCIGKTPDDKNSNYEEYLDANFNAVKKVYKTFINSNAKMLIHFSSISAVAEEMSDSSLDEEAECNPITDYGITKRMAEEFLLQQDLSANKKIIIIRPTRIHGPNDKSTIFKLYKMVKKVPYPFGAIDNERSFLAFDNLIFLLKKIIDSKDEIKTGIYNVNDDEPLSTLRIISLLKEHVYPKLKIINIPRSLFEFLAKIGNILRLPFNTIVLNKITQSRVVSNQKIKKALGVEKLPLTAEEGLIKTIKSFK